MKHLKLLFCVGASALGFAGAAFADDQTPTTPPPASGGAAAAPAAPAAPQANPMPYPAMTAPMVANPNPLVLDAGPIGKLMVDGVVSGMGFWQSAPVPVPGNHSGDGDITNAMVILNKTDGMIQFYVQAGAYSFPTLGVPYTKAFTQDPATFGFVPQGFLKIVPNSNFSVEAGALPTLIGSEYAFTFENMNIERGLLWNQEPIVSKGVQLNFTKGPVAASFAVTDGYYSGTYTSLSGLITYTFKNNDTLAFDGEGNVGVSRTATPATPIEQNNGQIFNLMYSHTMGPFTVSPYIQYSNSKFIPGGFSFSGNTWGGAILAKYNFTPEISLAGRVEYIASSGLANLLGYGVNSNAWSITLTPTYQKGIFFARGEVSYVGLGHGAPGLMFGSLGTSADQTRVLGEAGVVF
jgi:hypothetical protein